MRKAITNKVFILTALVAVAICISSFVFVQKANAACAEGAKSCNQPSTNKTEMLWDAFPRQFVLTLLIR